MQCLESDDAEQKGIAGYSETLNSHLCVQRTTDIESDFTSLSRVHVLSSIQKHY